MKLIMLITLIAIATAVGTGCGTLLTKHATASNPIVQQGLATTNDLESVAVIREAQFLNAALNPTPTSPLVNDGLIALATLLTAAGGWYSRHLTQRIPPAADTTTVTTTTPTGPPLK